MPDGKPYRKADGKHAPQELLSEYGKITSVNPEGKPSWSGFFFQRLEVGLKLASVIVCPNGEELNEGDAWAILKSALIDTVIRKGGREPLNPIEILRIADGKAAQFFRKPNVQYVLISSLSVKSMPVKRLEVAGCRIQAMSSRGKYPYPERIRTGVDAEIARQMESLRWKLVRVTTTGRSIHEAVDNAFRALSLLRGLWSLFATYQSWSITFGSAKDDPIGVIHAGPLHTLHYPNRNLATDLYWYERGAIMRRKVFQPNDGWQRIEKQRRWAVRRLLRLPFRKDVEDLIIRYVNALDQSDHDVAFLQMWSILETLTNTIGANYDETLRRTIWPYDDRKIAKEFLECARLRRNLYVHAARSTEEPDQVAYLIKSFVDPHLVRLIRNDFGVSNVEEYGQHLSLPTDVKVLERDKQWIEKALRIARKRLKKK